MSAPNWEWCTAPPDRAIAAAMDSARLSPCRKSTRGAAIWTRAMSPIGLVSTGHNRLVAGKCTGSADCRRTCAKRCEHAEAAALRDVSGHWRRRGPLELLHVKAVDGELVPSGQPSCWQCSRAIVADGRIAGVWLFHADGWRRYTAEEFHRLTLEGLGLVDRGGS